MARAFGVAPEIKHLPARNEVQHAYPDHSKARQVFGESATVPLEEGIARMAIWAQQRRRPRRSTFRQYRNHPQPATELAHMTQGTFPLVAIIVLTWNQRDLTLDCLASLAEMDYPEDRLQVIVVDNGSRDGTAAAVRERYPHVTVLENGDNLGFAEGNNVGIRHALQGPAEYIMLLNNDTVVDRQMLAELLTVMEQHPEVGIVGPKMLYFEPLERDLVRGQPH